MKRNRIFWAMVVDQDVNGYDSFIDFFDDHNMTFVALDNIEDAKICVSNSGKPDILFMSVNLLGEQTWLKFASELYNVPIYVVGDKKMALQKESHLKICGILSKPLLIGSLRNIVLPLAQCV